MNERRFQAWLVDRAPATVPATLTERVARIPMDVPAGRSPLADTSRGRRLLVVGLLAAAMTGSLLAAGTLVERQEAELPPAPMPANGSILIVSGDQPLLVDPVSGIALRPSGAVAPPARALMRLIGATAAAWSPDGQRVAYARNDGFRVVDIATGEVRPIASVGASCPVVGSCDVAWSPGGTTLAVTAGDDVLRLVDLTSGMASTIATVETVAYPVRQPTWSPDGTRLAFVADQDVWVVDRDGSGLTRIHRESMPREDPSEGTSADGGRIGPVGLQWSPDGRQIGFLSSGPWDHVDGWALEIVVIDPDGTDRRVIADAGECFCLGWGPPGFTWSPDGTQIAFVTSGYAPEGRVHDPKSPRDGGLYVAGADGSAPRLVYPDIAGSPAWQPVPSP